MASTEIHNILRACCACDSTETFANTTKHRYCKRCWSHRTDVPDRMVYLCEHIDKQFIDFTNGVSNAAE